MTDDQHLSKLFINGKEVPFVEPPKIEFKVEHNFGPSQYISFAKLMAEKAAKQMDAQPFIVEKVNWSKVSYAEAQAIYEQLFLRRLPCIHCEDRELWSRGLYVKLAYPVCDECLSTVFSLGLTARLIVRGKVIVLRKKTHRS